MTFKPLNTTPLQTLFYKKTATTEFKIFIQNGQITYAFTYPGVTDTISTSINSNVWIEFAVTSESTGRLTSIYVNGESRGTKTTTSGAISDP
mmetsp:Transcript_26904/g.4909  ORF Transcript_26904/g.4909 Transcript_26904/m.4909 type:complete len:92 (+) Transcript_26904:3220-3495(+)